MKFEDLKQGMVLVNPGDKDDTVRVVAVGSEISRAFAVEYLDGPGEIYVYTAEVAGDWEESDEVQ